MRIQKDKIIIEIPVTTPTGKARVKRRDNNFGYPFATKTIPIANNDYVEWQISYYVAFGNIHQALKDKENLKELFSGLKDEKVLQDIKSAFDSSESKTIFFDKLKKIADRHNEPIKKEDEEFHLGFELSDLLKTAFLNKLISSEEMKNLLKYADDIKPNETIEENFKVSRKSTEQKIKGGFSVYYEEAPLFIKEIDRGFFLEIILKHKQRAVGYQSMVYLCVKAETLIDREGKSFIGRVAVSKEKAYFGLDKNVIMETCKAFMIASHNHKRDIRGIIEQIIK